LPRGKTLHLGPAKEGQIVDQHADSKTIVALVEAGDIEIVGEGEQGPTGEHGNNAANANSKGRRSNVSIMRSGDR